MRDYRVYIMSNQYHTVLYIGVTNDIGRRVLEHKSLLYEGFTKKYKCIELMYQKIFYTPEDAICYEKTLKKFKRADKYALILADNPFYRDLSLDFHPIFSASLADIQTHVAQWPQTEQYLENLRKLKGDLRGLKP